jgi:hypothetical protein
MRANWPFRIFSILPTGSELLAAKSEGVRPKSAMVFATRLPNLWRSAVPSVTFTPRRCGIAPAKFATMFLLDGD